eukprot:s361_g25.t1
MKCHQPVGTRINPYHPPALPTSDDGDDRSLKRPAKLVGLANDGSGARVICVKKMLALGDGWSGDRALTATPPEGLGEVRQSDVRSRDGNDSAAGEIDAALREVSKSTLETENWYPEDSMELDAVLAQDQLRRMRKNGELGLTRADLGRCRFPENCMLQAMRSPQFKSPIMRLDVFLDEDIPEFPFPKVKSVTAA